MLNWFFFVNSRERRRNRKRSAIFVCHMNSQHSCLLIFLFALSRLLCCRGKNNTNINLSTRLYRVRENRKEMLLHIIRIRSHSRNGEAVDRERLQHVCIFRWELLNFADCCRMFWRNSIIKNNGHFKLFFFPQMTLICGDGLNFQHHSAKCNSMTKLEIYVMSQH